MTKLLRVIKWEKSNDTENNIWRKKFVPACLFIDKCLVAGTEATVFKYKSIGSKKLKQQKWSSWQTCFQNASCQEWFMQLYVDFVCMVRSFMSIEFKINIMLVTVYS